MLPGCMGARCWICKPEEQSYTKYRGCATQKSWKLCEKGQEATPWKSYFENKSCNCVSGGVFSHSQRTQSMSHNTVSKKTSNKHHHIFILTSNTRYACRYLQFHGHKDLYEHYKNDVIKMLGRIQNCFDFSCANTKLNCIML